MKRTIIRSLIACAAAVMAAISSLFAARETVNGITWTYVTLGGTASVGYGSYGGSSTAISISTTGAIEIPAVLGGCPVTSIGNNAFYGCRGLTNVTMPSGVTSIGSLAFFGSGLASVTIPDSVMSICVDSFYGCKNSFFDTTTIHDVTLVDGWVVGNTGSLFGDLNLMGIRGIGPMAFAACESLESVTIPGTVKSIGNGAFSGCSGLMSVTIGNGVKSIGAGAFGDCSSLTIVTIPSSVTSIKILAFSGCNDSLYDTNSIPGVKLVDGWAVAHMDSLPGDLNLMGVRGIGDSAFSGCSGLTRLTIGNGVTGIGVSAFAYCKSLTSVTMPSSVTNIGNYAFSGCSGLTSVTMPSSVTSIGIGTFEDCNRLQVVTIPDGVTSILDYAFSGCSCLTDVTIPDSVTGIGDHAFYNCSGLTSVTIPDGVTSIGDHAFCNCSGLTDVTIPSSVTSIGNYAFSSCGGLVSFEVAPGNQSYKSLSGLLLSKDCKTLIAGVNGEVMIPDSVTGIVSSAFCNCSGLTDVTIPSSVTSIGSGAFYGCNTALFDMTTIPGVKLVDGWAVGYADSFSGDLNLTGIRGIGDGAFSNCGGLTSVTIPDTVTGIGNLAFSDCHGLTSVMIPDSVTSIGPRAFYQCDNLRSMTMSDGVTIIGECAFMDCNMLTSVVIPNSVTSIGNSAFERCYMLTSVTIPDGVTSIGVGAFLHCNDALYDTNTVSGVKLVDGWAVGHTDSLSGNLDLIGVRGIGDGAFYGCNGLLSVTMPGCISSIGSSAFECCSGLTNITFEGNAPAVSQDSFYNVDCTVCVHRGSTGWGVDIPGLWNGLPIKYIEAGPTLIVSFDANGGKCAETQRYVEKGNALGALPMPTRNGYAFAGWWTAKSGGTKIKTSTKVTKNITYYARWTANKYKIKFNANGGTGTMKTISATYGKSVKLTANAFKRSKYTFVGWSKKKNGEVAYADKAKVKNLTATDGKTVTLYAVWKLYSYTVKFNANGGTGAAQRQTVNCGAKTKLAANAYVREGFEFAGWAKKKGGPVVYKNKASVKDLAKNGKTVTLYAVWKPAKWAVGTFKGEGTVGGKAATATLTVSSEGKISGKFVRTKDKKAYSFKTDGFDEYSDGALRATTTLKYGSKTCALEIAVGQAVPDDGVAVTFAEMEATSGGKTYATAFLQIRK